jgi:hypothetical protein
VKLEVIRQSANIHREVPRSKVLQLPVYILIVASVQYRSYFAYTKKKCKLVWVILQHASTRQRANPAQSARSPPPSHPHESLAILSLWFPSLSHDSPLMRAY